MIDTEGAFKQSANTGPMPTHEFNSFIWKLTVMDCLKECGAAGEALYQPFTERGRLPTKHPALKKLVESIFDPPLEVIQKHVKNKTSKVMAICGGNSKVKPLTPLEVRICNILVNRSQLQHWS